ncbi:MAG: hypothetical protein IJ518_00905 [Clostridia bacterium]|nr:hypothetical protein [Clostridia bacterium]
MSKRTKTIVCLLMSLVLLLPLNVMASAATATKNQVQPRWSYTDMAYVGLDITTGGTAYSTADAEGYPGTTTKIYIKMTLQKHTLLWWSKVETWEGTFNNFYGTLCETTQVGSGTYRVKAEFTVYSGSSSEDITLYSQELKFTKS